MTSCCFCFCCADDFFLFVSGERLIRSRGGKAFSVEADKMIAEDTEDMEKDADSG